MSLYSHPIHTITHSQSSINNDHDSDVYRPKYVIDNQKINQNIDQNNQNNRLPLNLFHSAAEYNKMLICNGKNRKLKKTQIIDGVITSLEYVNDHIFEKEIQKRAKARLTMTSSFKPSKKQSENCICCCCSDFCEQCAGRINKQANKSSQFEIKKARTTIDRQILTAKQNPSKRNRKPSHLYDKQNKKSVYYIKNKTSKSHNKNGYSSIQISNMNDISSNKVRSSRSKKSKGVDISHLIIKSMLEFNQKKKMEEMQKINKLNTKKEKEEYIQKLNQHIRQKNLQFSKLSRSKRTEKSISKHQTAIKYYQKIKHQVIESLQNDNYSKPLKKQLANYQLNVYDHQELSKRKVELNQNQIQFLRKKHQQQAKMIIQQEIQQKLKKTIKIKTNLKKLEKDRKRKLGSCEKRPFRPTADMIQNAFKNLVDEAPLKKQAEIFKNQRIKKNHNKV